MYIGLRACGGLIVRLHNKGGMHDHTCSDVIINWSGYQTFDGLMYGGIVIFTYPLNNLLGLGGQTILYSNYILIA